MQTATQTHTPGPWEARDDGTGYISVRGAANDRYPTGELIALMRSQHPLEDGRLMAVAPELLDALLVVQGWIKAQQRIGNIDKGIEFPIMDAAIARATNA